METLKKKYAIQTLIQLVGCHMLLWDDLKHTQRSNELEQHMPNYTDMWNRIAFAKKVASLPKQITSGQNQITRPTL